MKIGIVTYHHVINDGAVLQAHAQQQAIQKLFPQAKVEIVDFRYKIIEQRERFALVKDFLKFRKSAIYNLKKHLRVKRFIREHLTLSKVQFTSNGLGEVTDFINRNYDAIIVGSDEVWKIDKKKFSRPFPNLYWLPEPVKVIRMASAATANTLNLDTLQDSDKVKAISLLRNFRLIGVRDQFTFDFVRNAIQDAPVFLMPDPTFALSFEPSIYVRVKRKLEAAGVNVNKPILGISLSSNIKELNELSARMFATFKALDFQVVSIGQYNEHCHFNLTSQLDPLEWAHVYKYFSFCITDRFHSTIFCIRNHVNFVSVDFSNRYKENVTGKINDLLSRSAVLDHHLSLRDMSLDDVTKRIIAIKEKGKADNVSQILANLDNKLANEYNSFLELIKAQLTRR